MSEPLQLVPEAPPSSNGHVPIMMVVDPVSPPEVNQTVVSPEPETPVASSDSRLAFICDMLWCQECGQSYAANCPTHGSLTKIRDREIPSKAKLTVPHMLALKPTGLTSDGQNLYTIIAKKIVQKRTMFGPFDAPLSEVEPTCDMECKLLKLQVFHGDGTFLWLDQRDEEQCNWMCFVKPAKYVEEQNIVAYQYKDKIYFTTTKVLPPNQELKVWYAEEYRSLVEKDALDKLQADSDDEAAATEQPEPEDVIEDDYFKCTVCKTNFMSFEELEEHDCEPAPPPKPKERPKLVNRRKGRPMKRVHGRLVATRSTAKRRERMTIAAVVAKKKRVIPKIRPSKIPKPVFECMHCGKAICGENAYKVHLSIHTGKKPFVCDFPNCSKGFTSKYKLDRHVLIHTGTKNFKCAYCERSFNRKDHLKIHLAVHDQNRKPNMCDVCGKEYSSNITFRTHMAFHAADTGDRVCKICNKEFETKDALVYHIRVHSGSRLAKTQSDKRQTCPYCDKRFFTKKDVKRHLIVHTKKKDYLCQFCPHRFGRKDHLTRHIRATHIATVVNPEDGTIIKKMPGRPGRSKKQPEAMTVPTQILQVVPIVPEEVQSLSRVSPEGQPQQSISIEVEKVEPLEAYHMSLPITISYPSPLPSNGATMDPVAMIATNQQMRPPPLPMAVYAAGPHMISAMAAMPVDAQLPGSLPPPPPPPPQPQHGPPLLPPVVTGTNVNMIQPMPPLPVTQMRPLPPGNPELQHGFNQRLNTLYNQKFYNPPQSFEAMVGYIETLKFLENLPTTVGPPPPHGHPIPTMPNPPSSPYTSGYSVPPDIHIQRPAPTFPQQQHLPPPSILPHPPHPQISQHSQLPVHTLSQPLPLAQHSQQTQNSPHNSQHTSQQNSQHTSQHNSQHTTHHNPQHNPQQPQPTQSQQYQ